jgi:hypothetical protein
LRYKHLTQLNVQKPPPEFTIEIQCALGNSATAEIELENKLSGTISYDCKVDGKYLDSVRNITLKPSEKTKFRLVYTPLAQHKGVGSVSFSNANAEEFWYALRLDADDVESLKLAKATELD